jgi:2-haloacid dehalogenase
LAEHGEQLNDSNITALMEAYDHLSTFPDVKPALIRLSADASIQPVVFSNGSKTMVSNSVLRSQDLSMHASIFQDLITVDEVQRYKPSPASYNHLATQMGKQESQMDQMWLISGNPFDVVGARSVGMQAIWVDRVNKGWQDAVAPELRPSAIVHSLEQVVLVVQGRR